MVHHRAGGSFSRSLVAISTISIVLAGCEGTHPAADSASTANTPSSAGVPEPAGSTEPAVPLDPRLHQIFADATRQDPPADFQRPPDVTLTGKSVGKLYTAIARRWDTIRFATPAGKPIGYTAVVETELGTMEIALRPDLAPNHVRNFVALALEQYYDGLVFERTIHAKPDDQSDVEVEVIEAGCPLGTGDLGVGSLGYWLKPEFSKEVHEPGTVGACHGAEPDSAACRFYITLTKAPVMDGNFTVFGKVTTGLDIARRIFSLPVRNDPEYPEGDRPVKPVVIRKITIQTKE